MPPNRPNRINGFPQKNGKKYGRFAGVVYLMPIYNLTYKIDIFGIRMERTIGAGSGMHLEVIALNP
jgi:hypothetical protein